MEINIALNTVVYVMIFMFPGIIFRKFYFTREYSKEFDKGNLFERTLITVLLSVVILSLSAFVFALIREILGYSLLPHISYDTIRDLHNTVISSNELPNPNLNPDFNNIILDFFKMILGIYFLSMLFGFVAYFLSSSKIIKSSGIFKYKNYWQDIVNGTYIMPPNDKYTFGYAEADVLVDAGGENKLYRGKVANYYLCHNTNHLQTIVLRDAKKYEKDKVNNKTILKDIVGDNFVIEKDRILNINFTYVFVLKDKQIHIKVIKAFIDVVSVILYLWISILAVFFKTRVNEYLYTMPRKFVFLICGLFVMLTLKDFF
ncbi:hypothetical protein PG614_02390 [Riemerella anatipestifer]|nr:hypothetical protein [Riemerella anatipestifer]MDY3532657.1 hypothetical protein [Riemerella anatipestifer]MDY3534789.1 hypothetical protein [Riemerella anatipestifer]